jgi:hypothetical protein
VLNPKDGFFCREKILGFSSMACKDIDSSEVKVVIIISWKNTYGGI